MTGKAGIVADAINVQIHVHTYKADTIHAFNMYALCYCADIRVITFGPKEEPNFH